MKKTKNVFFCHKMKDGRLCWLPYPPSTYPESFFPWKVEKDD